MKHVAFSIFVVLLAISVFSTAGIASLGDAVMSKEKADVLVTIEVPSLNTIFDYIDTIMSEFGQDASMIKAGMASELFNISDIKLLDLDKPVEFIILNTKKYETPIIMSFNVADTEKFLEDFGGEKLALNEKTKEAKTREYTWTETEFDHDAYMQDLDAEKEINFEDYNVEVTHTSYLTVVDGMAILTEDKGLMEAAVTAAGAKAAQKRLVTGDLQGSVNMEAVMSIYAEEISAMKNMMMPSPDAVDAPFDIAGIMGAYFDAMTGLVRSTERIEFAAAIVGEGDIGLKMGMLPKSGTGLANFVAKQKPKSFKYLSKMPESSAFAIGYNMEFTDEFVDGYLDFISKIMGSFQKDGMTDEDKEKLVTMVKELIKSYGTAGAFSMAFSEDGMDIRGIYEIKSREMLMKNMKESFSEMMENWMKPFMASMDAEGIFDIKFEEAVEKYKGAIVNKMTFEFPMEEVPEEAKEVLKKVWGKEPAVYIGLTEKHQVMGFGAKGMDIVKATIDSLEAPPARSIATTEAYKSATSGFPEEGILIFYMSLGNLMKGIAAMAPEEDAGMNIAMGMFEKISIASYATKQNDAIVFGLKLPISDFISTYKGLMMGPVEEEIEIEEEAE